MAGLRHPSWSLIFAWSGIFFGLHRSARRWGEIILLDLAILYTTLLYWRRDVIAGAADAALSGLDFVRHRTEQRLLATEWLIVNVAA